MSSEQALAVDQIVQLYHLAPTPFPVEVRPLSGPPSRQYPASVRPDHNQPNTYHLVLQELETVTVVGSHFQQASVNIYSRRQQTREIDRRNLWR